MTTATENDTRSGQRRLPAANLYKVKDLALAEFGRGRKSGSPNRRCPG